LDSKGAGILLSGFSGSLDDFSGRVFAFSCDLSEDAAS
jgi:hypothetical protein